VQLNAGGAESHEQLLNQEPVIDHYWLRYGHQQLLIGEVRVVDGVQSRVVPPRQNAVQLTARHVKPPRNDQRRAAQVNERDL
jgi:hypothetical protein